MCEYFIRTAEYINLNCLRQIWKLSPAGIQTDPDIPASCCTSPQTGTADPGPRTSYSRPDSGTGHCGST